LRRRNIEPVGQRAIARVLDARRVDASDRRERSLVAQRFHVQRDAFDNPHIASRPHFGHRPSRFGEQLVRDLVPPVRTQFLGIAEQERGAPLLEIDPERLLDARLIAAQRLVVRIPIAVPDDPMFVGTRPRVRSALFELPDEPRAVSPIREERLPPHGVEPFEVGGEPQSGRLVRIGMDPEIRRFNSKITAGGQPEIGQVRLAQASRDVIARVRPRVARSAIPERFAGHRQIGILVERLMEPLVGERGIEGRRFFGEFEQSLGLRVARRAEVRPPSAARLPSALDRRLRCGRRRQEGVLAVGIAADPPTARQRGFPFEALRIAPRGEFFEARSKRRIGRAAVRFVGILPASRGRSRQEQGENGENDDPHVRFPCGRIVDAPIRPFRLPSMPPRLHSSKAASNARPLAEKSSRRVNSHASRAPNSRSMPESSHSIESGPL